MSLNPKTYEAALDRASRYQATRRAKVESRPQSPQKPRKAILRFKDEKQAGKPRTAQQGTFRGKPRGRSGKKRVAIEWRQAVIERDASICRKCGLFASEPEAHHIATRSRRPDLRFVVENGATVHHDCHMWIHDHPREAEKLGLLDFSSYELAHK